MKKHQMWRVGDRDKDGCVCVSLKGPVHIWRTAANAYLVYLLVGYDGYYDNLFNRFSSLEKAEAVADEVYSMLTKYGRNIDTSIEALNSPE